MNRWLKREAPRKSVSLALGWYVHEIVVGVANYAREANWILDDLPSRWGHLAPGWKGDGIITLIEAHHKGDSTPRGDLARRFPVNPNLRPEDIRPSDERLKVECLLSPGVCRFDGKTWLLLRVAERPPQEAGKVSFPIM
jgi:hypothetical protein